jgi:hypothetical protein
VVAYLGDIDEEVRLGVKEAMIVFVLVLARLLDPSSELAIAEHFYSRSALADLLGVPEGKINDDRLYKALDLET